MNNKIKLLVSGIILSLSISSVQAGVVEVAKKHPLLSILGVAGAGLYMQSAMHQSRDLSFHLDKVTRFFKEHPESYNPVANYVLWALENPANKQDYDRYKKLAERMELPSIPPYVAKPNNQPTILNNPTTEQNPNDGIYENPIVENASGSNIIYTPQGEKIDTGTEFPNTPIASWEDYLLFKKQSDILAESMKASGMGNRPSGYAAHHIVAWDDNRYPVCQDLRDLLKNNGIGINEAENGVYLPTRKVTKNSNEAYHPEIHTKDYYENVNDVLEKFDGDSQGMKNALKDIGQKLKNNNFKH
jgi:hypothetical protein